MNSFIFFYIFYKTCNNVIFFCIAPNHCQDSLSAQLVEKDQVMDKWRKERDTLVAALEVQLQKLLSSQAEKDKLIQQLQQPPGVSMI